MRFCPSCRDNRCNKVDYSCGCGFVGLFWPGEAVVNGEFFEVGEDGEWQFCAPGVTAKLVSGVWVGFDIDGRFFCFEKEFSGASDAEAVVGSFCGGADFDSVFVNDFFVGWRPAVFVGYIPAECFKKRVQKFAAELSFVILVFVNFDVAGKGLYKL